jgi:branched-subunit amino acid transport protein
MTLTDLPAIVLVALAVYLPKAVPLFLISERIPLSVRRWLDFVAPAVLAALVAPSILAPQRSFGALRVEQLAFVATFVVAMWTRRMLPSVASGAVVLLATVLLSPG